jgi:hypothetical protein
MENPLAAFGGRLSSSEREKSGYRVVWTFGNWGAYFSDHDWVA